ncbi:MAG: adenylosuccinate synthetase, partial [Flavobacteriales bacterium]|nr:adenylosuccinate synthetase [Flavobacteriales bacterium]
STTGRARRTGWLDLVALKYACEINGVTKLYMMKADVLSGFETLKVCTHYEYRGEKIDYFPYNIEEENIKPIYTEVKGWKKDLTKIKSSEEFPDSLNKYIDFIEKETGVAIAVVSVGPDRTQTINR